MATQANHVNILDARVHALRTARTEAEWNVAMQRLVAGDVAARTEYTTNQTTAFRSALARTASALRDAPGMLSRIRGAGVVDEPGIIGSIVKAVSDVFDPGPPKPGNRPRPRPTGSSSGGSSVVNAMSNVVDTVQQEGESIAGEVGRRAGAGLFNAIISTPRAVAGAPGMFSRLWNPTDLRVTSRPWFKMLMFGSVAAFAVAGGAYLMQKGEKKPVKPTKVGAKKNMGKSRKRGVRGRWKKIGR